MEHTCWTCKETKGAAHFFPSFSKPRGNRRCRACNQTAVAKWEAANPEKKRANQKRAYERWRETHPLVEKAVRMTPEGRLCSTCAGRFPVAEFPTSNRYKDGLSHHCRACTRARHLAWRDMNRRYVREKGRDQMRDQRARLSEESREEMRVKNWERRLAKSYTMSLAQFDALLAAQDRQCAICRIDLVATRGVRGRNAACVDHCHATGKVRGILCGPCNTALGQFSDDRSRILAAAAYLEPALAT